MPIQEETIEQVKLATSKYKYGFSTNLEVDKAPKGLSEDTIRLISSKKDEPDWMLKWRLEAFSIWNKMKEPDWAKVNYPKINYQDIYYYSAPKNTEKLKSLDEVDPELLKTYEKLGIPLKEQKVLAGVAVDAVFDSVSVVTTFRKQLEEKGVIFCPISEAIKTHPELVKKYIGSVIPRHDNYFSALNSAVFTDGSFVYIPKALNVPWSYLLTLELTKKIQVNLREH